MRILIIGIVLLGAMFLWSCERNDVATRQVSSEVLYGMFHDAGGLSRKLVHNSILEGCGYVDSTRDYPLVKFEMILGSYVVKVLEAYEKSKLEEVRFATLQFAHRTDSLLEKFYPDFAEQLLVSSLLSENVYETSQLRSPTDTVSIYNEATRVLLAATNSFAGGTKFCGIPNDIPYIVLNPLPKLDSFSIRIGLRMPEMCPSPDNYAVVFSDTLQYTDWAWADRNYHRKRLRGIDTLWVQSCLGNPLTGIKWCKNGSVGVGW